MELDQIKVEGLEIFANHGVFPEENVLGQKFIVFAYSATTSNYGLAYRQGSIPPSLSCRFAQAVATDSLLGCQLNATALSNTACWGWRDGGRMP